MVHQSTWFSESPVEHASSGVYTDVLSKLVWLDRSVHQLTTHVGLRVERSGVLYQEVDSPATSRRPRRQLDPCRPGIPRGGDARGDGLAALSVSAFLLVS